MSTIKTAPEFTAEQASALAQHNYGMESTAKSLPSERDQNYLLTDKQGQEFVLKIANSSEDVAFLKFQNSVLDIVQKNSSRPLCPKVIKSLSGEDLLSVRSDGGEEFFFRLFSYLPGTPLAMVNPHSTHLLSDLGRFIASLLHAFKDVPDVRLQEDLIWNMNRGPEIVRKYKDNIEDADRREIVDFFLQRYEKNTAPLLSDLPQCVIHNDGNDYNIIVSPPAHTLEAFGKLEIAGILDFGDMVHSYRICELAVVMAYALLGKRNPLDAAYSIVSGFHPIFPLSDLEMRVLLDMVCMRLIMSVSISSYQQKLKPDNEYLTISEKPAWDLLRLLRGIHSNLAYYNFRSACGLTPHPYSERIISWMALQSREEKIHSLIDSELSTAQKIVFDLSVGSPLFTDLETSGNPDAFASLIQQEMDEAGVQIGIGRYNESRLVYTGDQFRTETSGWGESRTLHLGMDVFVAAGSEVYAPLDGTVHSFHDNDSPQDYGPTIILEHRTGDDLVFYTLYGHLGRLSLEDMEPGRVVKKGARIGVVGDSDENGGWPPHLHVQIITDILGERGNFFGVADHNMKEVWLSLCPDPNILVRIPKEELYLQSYSKEKILELREKHIGKSLSISYSQPLKIVRGWKQYLYDENGRIYLDAVNNVPHVGHSHPRIVAVAVKQMAVLNTNTRYLHDNLVKYTERLNSLVPDPLSVCFIVNSGSEANDLALRLAWKFTGQKDVIVLDGAYHGNLSSLVDISPYKFDGPGGPGQPEHTHTVIMPDMYAGPHGYGDPEAGKKYASHVNHAVQSIKEQGRGVAAFIAESLLGCGGQIILPPDFLKEAFQFTRDAGGLCIIDEVQVGFGRVGTHFWGFETQNVVPDIVTFGKPIGDGFPLGAVITTPQIAESFADGMEYFNTFGGNPVSCAVGMAVLDVIEEEKLQENALYVGNYLKEGLKKLHEKFELIGDVRGLGLFLGVELVKNRETKEPAPTHAAYIIERMKDEGILISTDGPRNNVLKIKPPIVFSQENADLFLRTLDRILEENVMQIRASRSRNRLHTL
ncbi:aminotransferase class III-fold pyridoxal phosphate-dependent enzyme [Acidobacteriota bacterium]